jgi:thymidylate synthase
MKNGLDEQYIDLLKDILENGVKKNTRNGEVLSVFGRTIRYKFKDGKFPLLTTKKMHWRSIVTELMWFLQGRTDLRWLLEQGNTIWVGDAYKNWCRQFEVDPNNFNGEELAKGHNDQCWGYPLLENTSKEYKRGQINAYLEGKAEKPFFYLTQEEFINKIKTDDEFAKKWGSLGPVYGKQWRDWEVNESKEILRTENVTWPYEPNPHTYQQRVGTFKFKQIDQIQTLINDLKTNPDSRRLLVSAWNVGELDQMVLPPCHYGFQVYTRELSLEERYMLVRKNYLCPKWDFVLDEKGNPVTNPIPQDVWYDNYNIPTRAISLMWNQRSVDTFLGLPFNIASYGLLLEIIAKAVNMVPDELIGNLGDTHLYSNHIEQSKEQIGRELTDEERYNIWFTNNYETGMENYFDPNNLPDFDNEYYTPTPKRTREPYPLPNLKHMKTDVFYESLSKDISLLTHLDINDFVIEHHQSHPTIKAKLSN